MGHWHAGAPLLGLPTVHISGEDKVPKTMHNTNAYKIIFEGLVLEHGNLKSGETT